MDQTAKQTSPQIEAFRRAIAFFGSQAAMASAIECSQQYVSWVCRGVGPLSAAFAVKIHTVTDGLIQKHELRPDLFEAPKKMEAAS